MDGLKSLLTGARNVAYILREQVSSCAVSMTAIMIMIRFRSCLPRNPVTLASPAAASTSIVKKITVIRKGS